MKTFLRSEFYNLSLLSSFALAVLLFRFHEAGSNNFNFLLWNLFLAWIPFLLTIGLDRTKYKVIVLVKILLWLLFLPNAPYLITDMLHLHPRMEAPYWLDTFILFVFAMNGILLFYASTRAVWNYIRSVHPYLALVLMPVCFALCGYGVYMGRWLRFNSWDAVHHPFRLTNALVAHTFNPVHTLLIVQVTLLFSGLLYFIYRALQSLR